MSTREHPNDLRCHAFAGLLKQDVQYLFSPSCSLSDELLTSVSDLMEGRDLDVIVVELSGVADPASVRQNWDQAVAVCSDFLSDRSYIISLQNSGFVSSTNHVLLFFLSNRINTLPRNQQTWIALLQLLIRTLLEQIG